MKSTPAPMDDRAAALCIATLRAGHALTIVNLSPSMSPAVRVGDALTVQPGEPLRRGVLVAVERHGRIVVHRLIAWDAERVVLRGDANPRDDAPDVRAAVLGVVTTQRTRRGRAVDPATTPMRCLGWLLHRGRRVVRLHPRQMTHCGKLRKYP
jgi:hypothetical protein